MIEAHFNNIRNLIINNIRTAQSEIKIAVAWFTQKELFEAVMNALERGVKVSLIMMKDFINCGIYGLPLQGFVDKGGNLHFVSNHGWTMHNKFCLFDNRVVISGSYNWTYSAETRNAENVIATDDEIVCSRFDDYFNRLWEESFAEEKVSTMEISPEEVIQDFSFIYDELNAMVKKAIAPQGAIDNLKKTKDNADIEVAKIGRPIMPSLRSVEQVDEKEREVNTFIPVPVYFNDKPLKPGESVILKTISIPLANGRYWALAKYGTKLPVYCEIRLINAEFCDDGIMSFRIEKFYEDSWDSEKVDLNIKGLPQLDAGKIQFRARANIKRNGLLSLSLYCTNTRKTYSKEIQLVEGEDFIIGK